MAIYGIGAKYSGTVDVAKDFIKQGRACIGWSLEEGKTLFRVMSQIKVGDIMYIKSKGTRTGLRIKAIGIVESSEIEEVKNLGFGIRVKWLVTELPQKEFGNDKYNVRCNTIYEEYNEEIQQYIVNMIFQQVNKQAL